MGSFRTLPHAADWPAAVSGPGADAQRLPPVGGHAQGQMAVSCASCAERRRLLICSGAASRRGLPYGGSTRFHGGFNSVARSSGRFTGLRLRCGDWRGAAGGCHCAFLMMKRHAAGCRGPALRAARSRLTVLFVSAGHMPGAGRAGRCCRRVSRAECGPGRPVPC